MTASHHEKLARLVEELHQELAASPQVDPSLRAALETIVNDIRRLQPVAPPLAAEHGRATGGVASAEQATATGPAGPRAQGGAEGRESPPTAAAEEQPPHHTLIERLREAADEFEGKHPNLVGLIGSMIDALQGMGI